MTSPVSPSLPTLRQLLNEAQAGEWTAVCVQEWTQGWMVRDEMGEPVTPGWFAADDAALIATAITSLPALLDRLERQAAAIEAVQELADSWQVIADELGWSHGTHYQACADEVRANLHDLLSGITPTTEEKA